MYRIHKFLTIFSKKLIIDTKKINKLSLITYFGFGLIYRKTVCKSKRCTKKRWSTSTNLMKKTSAPPYKKTKIRRKAFFCIFIYSTSVVTIDVSWLCLRNRSHQFQHVGLALSFLYPFISSINFQLIFTLMYNLFHE